MSDFSSEHRDTQCSEPEYLAVASRSIRLLSEGKLGEALIGYERAQELCGHHIKTAGYLMRIGTIQWLLGRQMKAVATFRASVDGVLDGSIEFADLAGGVSQGLLLWYAGVTRRDEESETHALEYLRKLSKNARRMQCWPGPLALFVLGQKSETDALADLRNARNLGELVKLAENDLLLRRELCQALFYFGVRKRSEGNEGACQEMMVQCANLENPLIENEWYLARAEVGLSFSE